MCVKDRADRQSDIELLKTAERELLNLQKTLPLRLGGFFHTLSLFFPFLLFFSWWPSFLPASEQKRL